MRDHDAIEIPGEGRRRLLADGTLMVSVLATVTERDGTTTSLQAVAMLGGP